MLRCAFICVTLALAVRSQTQAAVVVATADTYLTTNGGLGGWTSVHGSDTTLGVIGALCAQATPLLQFDLSSFARREVIGDATLTLHLMSSWNNATCTQTVNVYQEFSNWAEASTTWANLPGPGWWDEPPATYGVMGTTALDSKMITCVNGQAMDVSWIIPNSVVQSWIDAPASNHGLVLISLTTPAFQDLWFSSREGGNGPSLTFMSVPEPSTLLSSLFTIFCLFVYACRFPQRSPR